MKRFQWLFFVAALSLTIFSTSCDPDPVDTVINVAPEVTILAENPNPNSTASVYSGDAVIQGEDALGSIVFVGVEGVDFPAEGSAQALASLEILLDNARISADDIFSITDDAGNAIDPPNNPQLTTGDYAQGFKWEIGLRLPAAYGTYVYTFVLADTSGDADIANESNEVSITFTLEEEPFTGTLISGDLTGVLLNSAGPPGTGGLNLATGEGVGSADGDIKDNGIDQSQPAATNWVQTISPTGANTMYSINRAALAEGWSFTDVTTIEAIAEARDIAGTNIAESAVVAVGDVFVVENGTNTFLLEVTDVNVTSDSNADSYTFSVKF